MGDASDTATQTPPPVRREGTPLERVTGWFPYSPLCACGLLFCVISQDFPFSFGNYICKALLGSIDPEFDRMDEGAKGCCNVQ